MHFFNVYLHILESYAFKLCDPLKPMIEINQELLVILGLKNIFTNNIMNLVTLLSLKEG